MWRLYQGTGRGCVETDVCICMYVFVFSCIHAYLHVFFSILKKKGHLLQNDRNEIWRSHYGIASLFVLTTET